MAVLKIYNDISSEEDKIWYAWAGSESVCYKDIDTFCESIPKDDDTIDIRLFCNGGSVQEGWAMYDRLRATGKKITCTVEGKAASMATVLLMAAPKEDRHAYENASICVHNPWVDPFYLGQAVTADDLRKAADDLQREQDKILDLYVERCGCDRDEMQALMNEDKYIDTAKAIEMGLINDVLPPLSASKKEIIINHKHNDKMEDKKETVEVKQSLVNKLLKFFGKKSINEITFGMDLNTADGQVLTVEREEGEPQVGDKASPNGEWLMPDGKTIVVADGEITEIRPASSDEKDKKDDKGEEGVKDEKEAEIEALKAQVTDLEAQKADLQAKLEKAEANAKTADDLRILNAVKMAGGEKALAKISSSYKPEQRKPDGSQAEEKVSDREQTKNAILERMSKLKGNKNNKK